MLIENISFDACIMVTNTCTRQCRLLIVVQPVRICGCQQLQEWTMGKYNVHELFWMLQCVTVPRNYSFHAKFRRLVFSDIGYCYTRMKMQNTERSWVDPYTTVYIFTFLCLSFRHLVQIKNFLTLSLPDQLQLAAI